MSQATCRAPDWPPKLSSWWEPLQSGSFRAGHAWESNITRIPQSFAINASCTWACLDHDCGRFGDLALLSSRQMTLIWFWVCGPFWGLFPKVSETNSRPPYCSSFYGLGIAKSWCPDGLCPVIPLQATWICLIVPVSLAIAPFLTTSLNNSILYQAKNYSEFSFLCLVSVSHY